MLSLLLLTGVTQASTYVSWSELMNTSAFQPGDCLTVGADILLDLDDDATFELLEIQASGAVQILSPNIALEASEIAISGKLLVGKDADTEVISEVDGVEIRLMGLTGGCNQWTLSEAPSGYALSPSGALASTRPRTIFVNDGGALEVYGKDSGTPWTTLTSSSTTGTYAGEPYTRIDVADDTGWQIGADIALAGTGFGRFDSERFSLGSGGGGTWYLPGTASYEHFADPAGAYGPSVAGEVARLSRSVKIYTPPAERMDGWDALIRTPLFPKGLRRTVITVARAADLLIARQVELQLRSAPADVLIVPDLPPQVTMLTGFEQVDALVAAGERAARAALMK